MTKVSEQTVRWMLEQTYDWDKEREVLHTIQQCQRNWNYDKFDISKPFFNESIQELLYIATHSPTKQHEAYFDVYWTADRDVIQEMSRYTWGNTHRREPPSNWRNTQSNASVYFIWVAKEPDTHLNSNADGTLKDNTHPERWLNAYVSIGMSLSLTARAAARMGYKTGYNKNHNDIDGNDYWERKLGILPDVISGKKRITYGLGIGYPRDDMERYESDETELMIGAANGSKITLTKQEKSPSQIKNGKKMRMAKIVDIKGKENTSIFDDYGNEHILPEKATFKINSFRKRKVNVVEIKKDKLITK